MGAKIDQDIFVSSFTVNLKLKFRLPMGSSLGGVLACLFLEFLESGHFKNILPQISAYFRYIDYYI